jgi:serralysin
MKQITVMIIALLTYATSHAQLERHTLDCATDVYGTMYKKINLDDRGVADNFFTWANGATLLVKFMSGGSTDIRTRVMNFAKQWEQYANIKLKFVADTVKLTNIRIQLNGGNGHYSAVGTQCKDVPQDEHTLTLDTLDMLDIDYYIATANTKGISINTWDDLLIYAKKDPGHWNIPVIRRKSIHEFGHALGLLHEQSYPGAIKWNKSDSVYNWYLKNNPTWTKAHVDANVFEVNKQSYTNGTGYDPKSIMHYDVKPWQTLDGYSLKQSMELSEGDKKMIATIYPKDKAISDYLVSKVKINGAVKVNVVHNKLKDGLSVYPMFDVANNEKPGQVYYVVKILDEYKKPILTNKTEFSINGVIATYVLMNIPAKAKLSYNKLAKKNLEIFFPYSKLEELRGKKIMAEFVIFQNDTANETLRMLGATTTTTFLNIPK